LDVELWKEKKEKGGEWDGGRGKAWERERREEEERKRRE